MHLFAQAALRSYTEAVADDEHADHQLRVNRGTPRMAVVAGQTLPQIVQIEEAINAPQQVILGNVVLEVEGVEQLLMAAVALSHHHLWINMQYAYCTNIQSMTNVFQQNRPVLACRSPGQYSR
jgi:hypothetical protein